MVNYNNSGEGPKRKSIFDKDAFKRGIAYTESRNFKNPYEAVPINKKGELLSSAAGKYQFLYNEIKNLPQMRGISKEEFLKSPELQEMIMDLAIEGKLPDRPGYYKNANDLTNSYAPLYGENWRYRPDEIAALTHYLGRKGARDYLKAQLKGEDYNVSGKTNMDVEDYLRTYNEGVGVEYTPIEESQESQDPSEERVGFTSNAYYQQDPVIRRDMQSIDRMNLNNYRRNIRLPNNMGRGEFPTYIPPSGGMESIEEPIGDYSSDPRPQSQLSMPESQTTKPQEQLTGTEFIQQYIQTNRDKFVYGGYVNRFEDGGEINHGGCGGPGQPPCEENSFKIDYKPFTNDLDDNQTNKVMDYIKDLKTDTPISKRDDFSGNLLSPLLSKLGRHGNLKRYYFGQPLTKDGQTLKYSKYRPVDETNPNSIYISIQDDEFKDAILHYVNNYYPENDNNKAVRADYSLTPDGKHDDKLLPFIDLGGFKIKKLKDEKGEYVQYYDVWNRRTNDDGNLGKKETMGAAKPFEVYDRIYIEKDSKGQYKISNKQVQHAHGGPIQNFYKDGGGIDPIIQAKKRNIRDERYNTVQQRDNTSRIVNRYDPNKMASDEWVANKKHNELIEKTGEILPHTPQSFKDKSREVILNPMTAITHLTKHGRIPDNMSKGERNPYDYAMDIVNPAWYAESAKDIVEGVDNKDITQVGYGAFGLLPFMRGKGIKKVDNVPRKTSSISIPLPKKAYNNMRGAIRSEIELGNLKPSSIYHNVIRGDNLIGDVSSTNLFRSKYDGLPEAQITKNIKRDVDNIVKSIPPGGRFTEQSLSADSFRLMSHTASANKNDFKIIPTGKYQPLNGVSNLKKALIKKYSPNTNNIIDDIFHLDMEEFENAMRDIDILIKQGDDMVNKKLVEKLTEYTERLSKQIGKKIPPPKIIQGQVYIPQIVMERKGGKFTDKIRRYNTFAKKLGTFVEVSAGTGMLIDTSLGLAFDEYSSLLEMISKEQKKEDFKKALGEK